MLYSFTSCVLTTQTITPHSTLRPESSFLPSNEEHGDTGFGGGIRDGRYHRCLRDGTLKSRGSWLPTFGDWTRYTRFTYFKMNKIFLRRRGPLFLPVLYCSLVLIFVLEILCRYNRFISLLLRNFVYPRYTFRLCRTSPFLPLVPTDSRD